MFNKIFNKIAALLIFIIVIFLTFTYFIIFPKVTTYFYNSEFQNIQNQLSHFDNIVKSEASKLTTTKVLSVQNYKKNIMRVTQTAYDIMEAYYTDYKLGIFTKEVAIKEAINTISKIKYGHQDDYIFILDKKGTYFYHPDKDLLKANMYYMTDVNGRFVTQNVIKSVEEGGDGFTSYWWPKIGQDGSYEKLTFSKYFKELDLIISSGIYMDKIDKEINFQKDVSQKSLQSIFGDLNVLKSGFFYIVQNDNVLINKEKLGKIKQSINAELLKTIKKSSKNKDTFYTTSNGKRYLQRACYNEYFDWYIVALVNEDELFTKAKDLDAIILNTMIAILALMFIIGLYLANRLVVEPINKLSSNALKIKDGDFSIRNEIKSHDEVGILAKQFNFMLDKIEDSIKDLEIKVNLRTQELRHKLLYDELTGLKNRYSFLEHVKVEKVATVVLVDIDAFDNINELYGYRVGNEVLTKFAYFLKQLSDENCAEVYRIYGNSFAILYMNSHFNFDDFEKFIHTILSEVKQNPIAIEDLNLEIFLDATLGIAICQDQPLKKANIALRKAKDSSQNFFVYNNEIDTKKVIENTIYWRNKLKEAIDNDLIVPFFQPIVTANKEIIKYEVLMRMEDNDAGEIKYITPNHFLGISLRTKQYIGISKAVIFKGLDALNKTTKDISVNFSFTDINDVVFMKALEEKFNTIPEEFCRRLVFEILESDSIENYDILKEFIEKYRKKGVRIAIDDFGAGFSNFSHIMEIRPDFLKIDSSLVKNIHEDKDAYELLKSIALFSQALGMKTIAEFVHCQEVYDLLVQLGIDEYQGYYFGAPQKEI